MPKPKILVVDDTGFNRMMVQKILSEIKCDVVQAASGAEAMKFLSRERFHVVITDLMMPQMDGVELHRQVSRSKYYDDHGEMPLPPFILLTAFSSAEMAESAAREGFKELLLKPVDRERLLSAVRTLLENRAIQEIPLKVTGEVARQLANLSDRLNCPPERIATALIEEAAKIPINDGVSSIEAFREILQSCIHPTGD